MPELDHSDHAVKSLPTYTELGLDSDLAEAMHRLRLSEPTQVQCEVIPRLLAGQDCFVRTRPGAGKTNAYLLPILQSLEVGETLQALLIQPTRSLALQLDKNLRRFSDVKHIQVAVAAGPERAEGSRFRQPGQPNVLVATPRRVLEMLRGRQLETSAIRFVVIDEAEVMLAGGEMEARESLESLREVLRALPAERQTVLIAADWTAPILELADEFLRAPARIEVSGTPVGEAVEHCVCPVGEKDKRAVLLDLLRSERAKLAIVFLRDAASARDLVDQFDRAHLPCRSIDDPSLRSRADRMRRPGPASRDRTEVVLAQDPASARLSTIPASHLVHFDLPDSPQAYTRRLEACSRLSRRGRSIALADAADMDCLAQIEKAIGRDFTRIPAPEPRADHGERPRDSRDHAERGEYGERPERGGRGRGRDDRGRGRDDRGRGREDRGRGRDGHSRRGGDGYHRGERGPAAEFTAPSEPRAPLHETLPPDFVQSTAPRATVSSDEPAPDSRYGAIRRDAELEARGLQPVPRTLGSRFKPAR